MSAAMRAVAVVRRLPSSFGARAGMLLLAVAGLLLPPAGQAQEPPPPVTDTVAPPPAVPADTVALPDTSGPPPFVRFPLPAAAGRGAGVWIWDREALLAESALTLADLLERLPGIDVFRSGTYLQPEVAGVFGGTADRIEIVRDGFVLDPMHSAALDLSTVRLVQLGAVVIERRVDLLRITLHTDEAAARDPYSRVEAGLGQPPVNMFRGIILGPHVIVGPLAAAVERIDTEGRRGREPADIFETWAKWGYTRPTFGVQGEVRRYTLRRRSGSPWPLEEERDELVLRARLTPLAGVTTEAYVGRTDSERLPFGVLESDTTVLVDAMRSMQAGARAALQRAAFAGYAALRYRDGSGFPRTQADAGGSASLGGMLHAGADLTHTTWEEGSARLATRVHAGFTPAAAIRIFAEAANGSRAVRPFRTTVDTTAAGADERTLRLAPVGSNRTALRGGAEANLRGMTFGAAALRVETDSVPAFGMPFDSSLAVLPGGATNAVEAWARLSIPRTPFAVDGWIVEWLEAGAWSYVPARSWRVALEASLRPLESGNVDIRGRVEARHRSPMLAPAAETQDVLAATDAYTAGAASLYIRIIDIHIFGRYENIGDRALGDLPGRPSPGPRFMYGVRWSFWN